MKKTAMHPQLDDFSFLAGELELSEEMANQSVKDFEEDFMDEFQDFQEGYIENVEDEFQETEDELEGFFDDVEKEHGPKAKMRDILPGSDIHISDEEEKDESLKETDYENDNDISKFHEYLARKYQDIPKHDGESVAGCERAIVYLDKLDREISKNIREDEEHILDIDVMSEYQQMIMKDVVLLKDHIKKLKRKFKENAITEKKADSLNEDGIVKSSNLTKEAAATKLYLTVDPFIRAICGILINSVVSAGKPFEKVYEYLVKKYEITAREELEILQVLMDMGQPIFKDRGSLDIPEDSENKEDLERLEEELSGVDFITNYFG